MPIDTGITSQKIASRETGNVSKPAAPPVAPKTSENKKAPEPSTVVSLSQNRAPAPALYTKNGVTDKAAAQPISSNAPARPPAPPPQAQKSEQVKLSSSPSPKPPKPAEPEASNAPVPAKTPEPASAKVATPEPAKAPPKPVPQDSLKVR